MTAGAVDPTAGRRSGPMRLLVHDFSGHPFQADLSRALAERGHVVTHVHCSSYSSGKGLMEANDAPPNLCYEAIPTGAGFARYSVVRRVGQELVYGARFVRLVRRARPDVVLSCNDPLLAKAIFGVWARARRQPWVFWLQDLYSLAMAREAAAGGRLGRALGEIFQRTERWLLRSADAVVPITDDFHPILDRWGVPGERRTVIENWAPLAELPVRPRVNPWRQAQGLGDRFVFLYSGTLGLKHNPDVLYHLAKAVPDSEVVVISEGLGVSRLEELQRARLLPNLRLLPFQPYDQLPDVLAAADVMLVLLETWAGTFSVPSKVLTYLCAGRPILGAVPAANLAARTIVRAGGGMVVEPSDTEAFVLAAKALKTDDGRRHELGRRARQYAETTFDRDAIAERFENVVAGALGRASAGRSRRP